MPAPPAICSHCGWMGPAPGYVILNSTNISFKNSYTQCPRCGKRARIVDGVYDHVEGLAHLIRTADLSAADKLDLWRVGRAAASGGDIESAAADLSPDAAAIIDAISELSSSLSDGKSRDWVTTWLAIFSIVVAITFGTTGPEIQERLGTNAQPPVQTEVVDQGSQQASDIEAQIREAVADAQRRAADERRAVAERRIRQTTRSERPPAKKKPKRKKPGRRSGR